MYWEYVLAYIDFVKRVMALGLVQYFLFYLEYFLLVSCFLYSSRLCSCPVFCDVPHSALVCLILCFPHRLPVRRTLCAFVPVHLLCF